MVTARCGCDCLFLLEILLDRLSQSVDLPAPTAIAQRIEKKINVHFEHPLACCLDFRSQHLVNRYISTPTK